MSVPETRSIIVEHSNGSATLVEGIPANAKITYGGVNPGKPGYGGGNCLRVYTSQNNQLAVIRDVDSFHDLSLTIKHREVTISTEHEETHGPSGLTNLAMHQDRSHRILTAEDF